MSVLRLNDVSIRYGNHNALLNASLKLISGEHRVILGASGSGKTSLLRAVAGFVPISKGEIWIGGKKVSSVESTLAPNLRGVGVVFQDYALFSHLNVLDNVVFGIKDKDKNEGRTWLERVNLLEKESAPISELSGGEQQRVALARALAAKPALMLLDEPFSNLDRTLRKDLRVFTRKTLKEAGQSAIYVTHDSEEAMECGDSISVLHKGQLVQTGNVEEIYQRPLNHYVAESLGEVMSFPVLDRKANSLDCGWLSFESKDGKKGDVAMFRPEHLKLVSGGPLKVISIRFKGRFNEISCIFDGEERVFYASQYDVQCRPGDSVGVQVLNHLGLR